MEAGRANGEQMENGTPSQTNNSRKVGTRPNQLRIREPVPSIKGKRKIQGENRMVAGIGAKRENVQ